MTVPPSRAGTLDVSVPTLRTGLHFPRHQRRVQTVDRLPELLAELLPGQAKRDIPTGQAKAMLATVRPRDIAGKTRRIATEELAELVAVEAKIKKATVELKAIVLARGSRLTDIYGADYYLAAKAQGCNGHE
jgi:transposase